MSAILAEALDAYASERGSERGEEARAAIVKLGGNRNSKRDPKVKLFVAAVPSYSHAECAG